MTDERDPVRWADAASDCDPALRRALDTAREGLGDAGRADALALGIEQAVRARAAGDGEHGLGSLRMRGLRRWLPGVGVAGLIAGLGGAAWSAWSTPSASEVSASADPNAAHASRTEARGSYTGSPAGSLPKSSGDRAPLEREASERSVDPPAVARTVVPAPAADLRDAPTADSASPSTSASARVDRTAAGPARSRPRAAQTDPRLEAAAAPSAVGSARGATSATGVAPAQTDVPPELQLLSSAQRALRATPADALALADLHARAYPSGRFVEEREEIAISALFALGERDAGHARARAFLARYPRSLSAARIATLIADGR